MIVSLTIRCDWPRCRERLTYDFATLRPKAPGWRSETDGAFSLHLCPAHNRKSWNAVKVAIAETVEAPSAGQASQNAR